MGDQPTVTDYQAKERLDALKDLLCVAFGEESKRTDARAEFVTNTIRQRQKDQDRQQDAFRLQMMVSRHYAALYGRVMQQIADTQAKICAAIIKVQGQLLDAEQQLTSVLKTANKLGGETPVFQYEDGTIRTDTGRILGEQGRAALIWREGMPSGADYERARKQVESVKDKLRTLQGYDTEVRGLADDAARLESTDTPESRLTIQGISKQVSIIKKKVEEIDLSQRMVKSEPKELLIVPVVIPDYSQ